MAKDSTVKTLSEIDTLLAELTAKRSEALESARREFQSKVDSLKEEAEKAGIKNLLSYFNAPTQPAPIKYRLGENAWNGRGRRPPWFIEHAQANGISKDDKAGMKALLDTLEVSPTEQEDEVSPQEEIEFTE